MLRIVTGLVSAVLGLLVHLPDDENELRDVQVAVNEFSWIPALLGGLAIVLGLTGKQRSWLAIVAGAMGLGASIWPFMQHRAAAEDMETAMRAGLGKDYETRIPAALRWRLPSSGWSLANALGERERSSQARIRRDIVYSTPDGLPLHMDVYQPLSPPLNGIAYPAVIVIQGGGWRSATRGGWFEPHNRYLASQGYVVFDIEHRQSSVAKWPAQLEDVREAIRWVKKCAGDYHVDPQRIATMGRSSGAQLALMAGMRSEGDDTNVQAMISLYGPTDLQLPDLPDRSPAIGLIGGRLENNPAAFADASPIEFARDNLPPMLLIEGMMDTVVPYHHGDKMANRLIFTNTPFVLLRIPWARHGFDALLSGLGAQLAQYHIDRFLAYWLHGANDA